MNDGYGHRVCFVFLLKLINNKIEFDPHGQIDNFCCHIPGQKCAKKNLFLVVFARQHKTTNVN